MDNEIESLYDDISISLILIKRLYKSQINKDNKLMAIIKELEAYKKDYGFMAYKNDYSLDDIDKLRAKNER